MQWGGTYKRLSVLFYRVVIQAVLLFGADSWVLLDAITREVESNHVGFLSQITGEWAIQKAKGSWETPATKEVLRAVGMQSAVTYIDRRQEKVLQWVAL